MPNNIMRNDHYAEFRYAYVNCANIFYAYV